MREPRSSGHRAGAASLRTAFALLLLLSSLPVPQTAAQVATPPSSNPVYDGRACSGRDSSVKTFRLTRMIRSPSSAVLVTELGIDPTIKIYCIRILENPDAGECAKRSVPRLCRNFLNVPELCESLAEYTYSSNREVVRGETNGPDVKWLLLWDPRNKPSYCYPRDVVIEIEYALEKPLGKSTVLAVIAIVGVAILAIAIGAFGLSRLLSTAKRNKESAKMRERDEDDMHGVSPEDDTNVVICPRCSAGQEKNWEGEDVQLEMVCRECGVCCAGWHTVGHLTQKYKAEGYPLPDADVGIPSGITSAEIAMRYDPSKGTAELASKFSPQNPLRSAFDGDGAGQQPYKQQQQQQQQQQAMRAPPPEFLSSPPLLHQLQRQQTYQQPEQAPALSSPHMHGSTGGMTSAKVAEPVFARQVPLAS